MDEKNAPHSMHVGSDEQPVVIVSSTRKKLLLLFTFILFVCIGAPIIAHGPITLKQYIAGYGGVLFGCLGIAFFVFRLISPEKLVLSPHGIDYFNGIKTLHLDWPEIARFVAARPSKRVHTQYVGVVYAKERAGLMSGLANGMSGGNGYLGATWAMDTPALVALLNDAKARWEKK